VHWLCLLVSVCIDAEEHQNQSFPGKIVVTRQANPSLSPACSLIAEAMRAKTVRAKIVRKTCISFTFGAPDVVPPDFWTTEELIWMRENQW